ncbi:MULTISPECIES: DUF928 domain-containing protein [unclassified Coleofasciculus]|uniref:DUF928 domain-containing protein n=1 Tax=unclassified Coleofasciculus TaxID=2692782 RepID=UPI00187DEB40|nr:MULTISPECIES: DUF928 domain-containing protein [unclassified Coleofasciculus]MBE9128036.1 DUF928 domain-containing protein [Coleofasciculus sp. LEGE 07081]MBE9151133.1 DUF928 domain-containing protein [Coleofasciculus sp. LEGE 07092]
MRLALILSLALAGIACYPKLMQAQLTPTIQNASSQQEPIVPPGRPPERKPAGTRGDCEETNTSFVEDFTPLLPVTDSEFKFSGRTLTGHPTFWFYVPYQTSSLSDAKFLIEEQQSQYLVYQTGVNLPTTPGFVKVSLPSTENPLQPNQAYRWQFIMYCTSDVPGDRSKTVSHQGLIERVDMPNLETQLETATLAERVNFYIDNSLWYDASADLTEIRTIPQVWHKLLKAIGLEHLEGEPIWGSVEPSEQ